MTDRSTAPLIGRIIDDMNRAWIRFTLGMEPLGCTQWIAEPDAALIKKIVDSGRVGLALIDIGEPRQLPDGRRLVPFRVHDRDTGSDIELTLNIDLSSGQATAAWTAYHNCTT